MALALSIRHHLTAAHYPSVCFTRRFHCRRRSFFSRFGTSVRVLKRLASVPEQTGDVELESFNDRKDDDDEEEEENQPTFGKEQLANVIEEVFPPEALIISSACLVGLLTGIAVIIFNNAVHEIRDFFWDGIPSRGASWLREEPLGEIWQRVILVPVCGGVMVGALNALQNILANTSHGTTLSASVKATLRPFIKAVAASITLGTGNSLGPEGPSVEIGASVAKGIGHLFDSSSKRRLSLVAAGSAAGISSGFNAAVAGCFFAVESVLWPSPADPSSSLPNTTSMVILSAVIASIVSEVGLGSAPAFAVPQYDFRSPSEFRELEMPRQKDPAWQYVSEVPGESDTESPRLQCQFCKGNFTTTITRMKSHLGKIACRDIQICQCVPDSVVNEVREHIAMATAKKAKRSHIFGSSAGSSSTPMGPSNAHAQQLIHSMFPPVAHNTQSTIYTLVKKKEKEETDNCIMEAIVDCCLPFNVLRNKSFQLAIEKVASHGPGYKLPSFETARTKLLEGLKERADEYVKNVRKNWEMTGCIVMSDGWTDRRNRPHLNLLVASPHGTVFVKSICTTGKRKDANYIADFIIGAIEEHIGANNVVQVIADNASNYTAAGMIIERKWPHLFKTNCAAHCIDLMLEDIDKIDYVQPIMDNARRITKFMYKFQHVNDLMKKYTHDIELKRPGATRFATQFLCLQSVLKQEEPLRFMVASNDWKELPQSKTAEGLEITSIILGVSFWGEGKEIVKVVEPLVRVLRLVDSEGSTLGYLYEAMDMVKEAIKVIYKDESSKWKTLWDIIDRRWNGLLHSPIHAAAAYLNPPSMLNGRVKFTDPEVKKGMDEVFRRMVPEEGQDVIYEQFGHYFRKSKEIFDKMALQLLTSVHPKLPLYLLLGVICGLVSLTLSNCTSYAIKAVESVQKATGINKAMFPVMGGLTVGLIALVYPEVLYWGFENVDILLESRPFVKGLPADLLFQLVGVKIVATSLSRASGLVGGYYAPSLFIGAATGMAYGKFASYAISQCDPIFHLSLLEVASPQAYGLVGMAATLAGVCQVPLTSVLLLFELTQDYRIVLPLLGAVGLSSWITSTQTRERDLGVKTSSFGENTDAKQSNLEANQLSSNHGLYVRVSQRADLCEVESSLCVDDFGAEKKMLEERILVSEAMRTSYVTVLMGTLLTEAVAGMLRAKQPYALIVDKDKLLMGVFTLEDVQHFIKSAERSKFPEEPKQKLQVSDMINLAGKKCHDVHTATPNMNLLYAETIMNRHNVDQLAVVSEHKKHLRGYPVGVLDRECISLTCRAVEAKELLS